MLEKNDLNEKKSLIDVTFTYFIVPALAFYFATNPISDPDTHAKAVALTMATVSLAIFALRVSLHAVEFDEKRASAGKLIIWFLGVAVCILVGMIFFLITFGRSLGLI
ncbi:MAG: hypothetical protein QMC36_08170 [Patescibacteria group bacterium]